MSLDLTVIIPTYQNFQMALHAMASMVRHTEYPLQIIFVNNDSTQSSRDSFDSLVNQADFQHVSVLHMSSNKGWMGAINAAMEHVDTPHVALCNDDVMFIPGQQQFWRCMIRHLRGRVAAVGPSSNFVSGAQSLFYLDTPAVRPVKYLIGFCMVLRADVFREVGLLDETLPGGDDFDLSIRLRQAGWELLAEKNAYLHHIGQQTGKRVHQEHWDSLDHRDQTHNALIRKHGLQIWYETIMEDPAFRRSDIDPAWEAALSEEDSWWKDSLPEGKGINVGCGENQVEGTWGVDQSRPGGRSGGGRKFTDATPDMTGDAADLPMQDGSVDYIIARHLFEHLIDPIAALDEWKRVVRPGGDLLISCPNHDGSNTMLVDYTHVHAYTPSSLSNLLESQGWDVVDTQSFAVGSFGMKAVLNGS